MLEVFIKPNAVIVAKDEEVLMLSDEWYRDPTADGSRGIFDLCSRDWAGIKN